ncbi:MAG: cytochrome c biogenesis CcdA family protein [Actinomycetota bacterium]
MTPIVLAAFAAGMVSTVNPCGFAMLPAYLGFFLADQPHRSSPIGRVALAVSGGFLVVFTAAGILIAGGVRAVVDLLPWLALVVGAALVVVGVAQLRGRRLLPYLRGPGRARRESSFRGMFGFGVAYAVASLSCTLPIFLSLVGSTVAARSLGEATLAFAAYGGGMAIVVAGITVLVGSGRHAVVERMRRAGRLLDRIAGWTMTLAGAFIVWYWATLLADDAVALGSNRVVRWVDQASAWATGTLSRNAVAVSLAVLVAIGVGILLDRRRRSRVGSGRGEHPDRM